MTESVLSTERVYRTVDDALAQPDSAAAAGPTPKHVLDVLLSIWREIFGRDDLVADDDFFALGGHSLKALQLQVQVRNRIGYEMDLRCLFDAPTVAELAAWISADRARLTGDEATSSRLDSDVPAIPGTHVTHSLRLTGLDTALWERCANQLVERHESLRASLSLYEGAPRLHIAPFQPVVVPVVDLSSLAEAEREQEADRLLADAAAAPFEPDSPRYRFAVVRMDALRSCVALTVAAEIADANQPRTLLVEMLSLYVAAVDRPQAETARVQPSPPNVKMPLPGAAAECLVPLRREGSRTPVFWVHGGGGGAMNLLPLARALDPDQPVYGLQAKGYSRQSRPLTRIEPMAAYYIEALRAVQPVGPYRLCGYSFGGIVAYEMALQLHDQGESVEFLGIMDSVFPESEVFLTLEGSSIGALTRRFVYRLREWLNTPRAQKPAYLRERWAKFRYRIRVAGQAQRYRRLEARGQEIPDALVEIQSLAENAVRYYQPRPYPGSAVLFQSQWHSDAIKAAQIESWARLIGGLDVVPIPGDHTTMLEGENAAAFARVLEPFLSRSPSE